MNFEFWIEAEKFLYDTFFIYLFILGPMSILLINILLFIKGNKKKTTKVIFSTLLLTFIIFSTNITINFNKYKVLYDYERYVNYGIRNNKKSILVYDYPTRHEKRAYNDLYLVDNFRKVNLYEEEIIVEEVEFLGRDGDNFYFKNEDEIIYRKSGDCLEITNNISNPIREGVRFYLIDSRFEDIGFKEKSPYPYLLVYKIPESMQNKKFENSGDIKIKEEKEFTLGWINPTLRNQVPISK